MQNGQIKLKIGYFCRLFQIFVFNHDTCAPYLKSQTIHFYKFVDLTNNIGQVDKRRFIKWNGFCVWYWNVDLHFFHSKLWSEKAAYVLVKYFLIQKTSDIIT